MTLELRPESTERVSHEATQEKKSSRGTSKAKTLRQEQACFQWDIPKKIVISLLCKSMCRDGDDGDGGDDGHNDDPTSRLQGKRK